MKIAQNFCLCCCFYFFCFSAWATDSLAQKYPDILLTDDHGILRKTDMISDQEIEPYEIERDQPGFPRWQCFPVSDVKPRSHGMIISSQGLGTIIIVAIL